MARRHERAGARVGTGADRQPPPRSVRSRRHPRRVAAGADRRWTGALRALESGVVGHRAVLVDRADPRAGAAARLRRAVAGADDLRDSTGQAREGTHNLAVRDPGGGVAGALARRWRCRIRFDGRRVESGHPVDDLRQQRTEPSAQRRVLQHLASRRRQR